MPLPRYRIAVLKWSRFAVLEGFSEDQFESSLKILQVKELEVPDCPTICTIIDI
jgi:hypothetical protein